MNAEYGEPTMVTHPEFYHKQGAGKAKGVIIWSAGSGSGMAHPTTDDGGMPHFLDWLYGNGWDVFYMHRTGGKHFDDRPRHATEIRNAVTGLRLSGYNNIVLAGQSSGGLYSMLAASQLTGLHGLILTASGPSAGPITFWQALMNAKADRVAVVHLKNDRTIGQRDIKSLKDVLEWKDVPYLNIFEPSNIEGHGGAFKSTFSKRFGSCILDFLNPDIVPSGNECANQ